MSRAIIYIDGSRPKAQKLLNIQTGNGHPQTPIEETPRGDISLGKLRQKAKLVNLRSLDTKLMAELGKRRIGTLKMEVKAIQME